MISPMLEDALGSGDEAKAFLQSLNSPERRSRMTHESKSTPPGFPSNTGLQPPDFGSMNPDGQSRNIYLPGGGRVIEIT